MSTAKRRGSSEISRGPGTREPHKTVVVFAEGGKTEPAYVEGLSRVDAVKMASSVTTKPEHAKPLQLVKAAIEEKRKDRGIDEVWCIFDVEAPLEKQHPDLAAARSPRSMASMWPCRIRVSNCG
jgi:hypothetical protein